MKIQISPECILCLMNRQLKASQTLTDESQRVKYLKQVMQIIVDSEDEETAPVIVAKINKLQDQYFEQREDFEEEKVQYNQLMLAKEEEIMKQVQEAKDPIYAGLQFARCGNYIDFGALAKVEENKLECLLQDAKKEIIDEKEYKNFRNDLERATSLVYLPDNCGEIVLDKILIQVLKECYPNLDITVIVRGESVLNDVTMKEAKEVGLDSLVTVIGNGNGIGGTWIPQLSNEAKKKLDDASLIIAKGQGNFETLHGCGKNIYYAFLCKCQLFTGKFGLEQFSGVFINDRSLESY